MAKFFEYVSNILAIAGFVCLLVGGIYYCYSYSKHVDQQVEQYFENLERLERKVR